MALSKSAAASMLLLALLTSGCGRKGPLYMQQAPVKPAAATTAPIEQISVKPDLLIQSQPVPTQTESQKQP